MFQSVEPETLWKKLHILSLGCMLRNMGMLFVWRLGPSSYHRYLKRANPSFFDPFSLNLILSLLLLVVSVRKCQYYATWPQEDKRSLFFPLLCWSVQNTLKTMNKAVWLLCLCSLFVVSILCNPEHLSHIAVHLVTQRAGIQDIWSWLVCFESIRALFQ